ncbi:hypothetical protein [Shewanella sp. KCT]|uniref:hypothetical protein n=1 Tax=Shewanella sp. KCT TaxID=2569535 RepID=UPI0011835589|nr:hypothetical protein [Shewanella sp. KCT]TVP10569.1 hypothetical protein AYI87_17560 [Shewanella sp. KCT]
MAKLIIEINDADAGNVGVFEVNMKTEGAAEDKRTLSDAVVATLANSMKSVLPEITKTIVERAGGRQVVNTEVVQGQSLAEALAKHEASRKMH